MWLALNPGEETEHKVSHYFLQVASVENLAGKKEFSAFCAIPGAPLLSTVQPIDPEAPGANASLNCSKSDIASQWKVENILSTVFQQPYFWKTS